MRERTKLKKGDIIIIVVAIVLVLVLGTLLYYQEKGNLVHIIIQDKTYTYSMSEEQNIVVSEIKDSPLGENTICIEAGSVYMKHADCPDQICVKHKAISKNGEMIVCLPNKVFIQIENANRNEIDN